MRPVTLELGGKGANLVFADADIEQAIHGAISAGFFNAGQVCGSGSRLLVEESIYDTFVEHLTGAIATLKIGDPKDPETFVGPMISREQKRQVAQFVAEVPAGAQVVAPTADQANQLAGYYVAPTLVLDAGHDAPIAQEEVFGPVVTVARFASQEEAIELANGTPYGLTAGLWTSNLPRAIAVSRALTAGTVWVNAFHVYDPAMPFGGSAKSGFGRDCGRAAVESFCHLKSVLIGDPTQPDS